MKYEHLLTMSGSAYPIWDRNGYAGMLIVVMCIAETSL
jgi:hypothetical protein